MIIFKQIFKNQINTRFALLLIVGFFMSCSNDEVFDVTKRYRISTSDFSIDFHYTELDERSNFDTEKTYYWSDRNKIYQTQGAATNLLLDGEFVKYYPSGELMEMGKFDRGLKKGEWRTWKNNGNLESEIEYKNGLKWGDAIYIKGDTIIKTPYKSGEIHGLKEWIVAGKVLKRAKYKRGQLKNNSNSGEGVNERQEKKKRREERIEEKKAKRQQRKKEKELEQNEETSKG